MVVALAVGCFYLSAYRAAGFREVNPADPGVQSRESWRTDFNAETKPCLYLFLSPHCLYGCHFLTWGLLL